MLGIDAFGKTIGAGTVVYCVSHEGLDRDRAARWHVGAG